MYRPPQTQPVRESLSPLICAKSDRNHRPPPGRHAAIAALCLLGTCIPAGADNPLEEIVISSSRVAMPLREVGTSVSLLTRDDILQRGFLTLPELLRTQPAVAASNNGGAGKATSVRIRGEEGYRTTVMIDGIDVTDTSSPQAGPRLEHLLSTGVQRIEILRGPQGLSYGADAGGVINIQTEAPQQGLGGNLSLEQGRYGSSQYSGSIGASAGDLQFLLGAAEYATDGFNARSTDSDPGDDDGYDNQTLHAKLAWDASDTLRIEAVARRVEGDNEYDGCFDASFAPSNDCSDSYLQENGRLAAKLQLGKFSHQLAFNSSRTDREFFEAGAAFFAAEGALTRLSYLGRWEHSDRLNLVYGVDHENESIDDGSFDRDREQTGAYLEYQGRFADGLFITGGLRRDDNEDFGSHTSLRLSAAWVRSLAGGELKLKSSLGTGFRAPSLYEVSYNRGPFAFAPAAATDLNEETSEGYDLGVAWASDGGSYIELTWFDQTVDDLITFDLVGFSGYLQDAGRSDSHGTELVIDTPLGESLRLVANYTWNETETPGGEQRPFRPEHVANLGLAWADSAEQLRLGVNLRSSSDAVDTAGDALDDYVLVDLNASYRLAAGLVLYGRLENALDESYREIPTYNSARQSAYAGVRYEF